MAPTFFSRAMETRQMDGVHDELLFVLECVRV